MCPMGITCIQKSLGVSLRHAQAAFRWQSYLYLTRPQHFEDMCCYPLFPCLIVLCNHVAKAALDIVVDGIADYHDVFVWSI